MGRRVAIRKKALNEVLVIAKRNLQEFDETADNGNEFYVEMNEFVTSLIEKHIARETPANHENESVIRASLNSTCSDDAFRASPVCVTQSQETDVSSDEDTWSGSDIDSTDEQQLNLSTQIILRVICLSQFRQTQILAIHISFSLTSFCHWESMTLK